MAVYNLHRDACARCGSPIDVPHASLRDCLRANTEETRRLLRRSKELLRKRATLTAQEREDFLGQVQNHKKTHRRRSP